MSILFSQGVRQGLLCLTLITLLVGNSSIRAQSGVVSAKTQSAADRIELHQALLDLTSAWTVMCVAAHPDDEDGATLTVLRRKYGVHTVSLFSTFGEGGQNAIGPELYEELGAIRAQETVKASEIHGSEPHFLGLRDFGFSKSADEAFRIWGHDEALARMVYQIRKLRPDVIITNHNTTSGHGHHQATGRLVLEAFDAAADPKRFPEQLKTIKVWRVQRLYVRVSNEGGASTKSLDDEAKSSETVVSIDRNELDPIRGLSYAAQALQALQQHASQGPWPQTLPKEGLPPVRYRLARETPGAASLPPNPSSFLEGLELPEYLKKKLTPPTIDGRRLQEFMDEPNRIFKAISSARLGQGIRYADALKANSDRRMFLMDERVDRALLLASGISAVAITKEAFLVADTPSIFTLQVSNHGSMTATVHDINFGIAEYRKIKKPFKVKPNTTISRMLSIDPLKEGAINLPRAMHLYDKRLFGEEFQATVHLTINGVDIWHGVTKRVDVAPAVEIVNLAPSPYVFSQANLSQPLTFKVRLVNHQDKPFKGQFGIASPTDHITEIGAEIALAANETREFTVRTNVIPVDTPDERRTPRNDFGPIIVSVHPWESSTIISEREIKVVYSDARVAPNLRVGYVRSFDDSLTNALTSLGVESQKLSIEDIRKGDLTNYDTIIIDNRGYLAHPELVDANSRLMDFAKNGGTLIVFYHRTNEWNLDPAKNRPSLAPYPITLGNERVTDEQAPVTITEPLHPLLNSPNKIGPTDFESWIQERGLYYPKSWDPHYQTLFAMSDAGEEPLRGGLLVADYGRGHYIYTSMVWYRQLRAGVPGGYRMFANMISYGKR